MLILTKHAGPTCNSCRHQAFGINYIVSNQGLIIPSYYYSSAHTSGSFALIENFVLLYGVDDGARTHDDRNHNPGLYQLSYVHHSSLYAGVCLVRLAGFEPATLGLEGRVSIRLSYRRRI